MLDFRPRIHIHYRKSVVAGVWILGIAGVVSSFFTLPLFVAVPFALLGLFIPWLCSRFLYRLPVVWITPMTSAKTFYNRLGVALFRGSYRDRKDVPGIGLLYENRFAAKESYAVLRSWNFGRFIDEHRNIHASFVREGGSRYSFFIYPGVRVAGHMAVEDCAKNEFPNTDVDAEVFRVLLWTSTPIDCSENPKKEELIESLTKEPVLILQTLYATEGGIKEYAKRPLILKDILVVNRKDLPPKCIEAHQEWYDGKITDPESAKRCAELLALTDT